MKQTMRIWLALVLALCAGTTAWGQTGSYQLTTGTLDNCDVAFSGTGVTAGTPATATAGSEVTITVTPSVGYATKGVTVKAYMSTDNMRARTRANEIIEDITAIPVEGNANAFTITMPAANIVVDATTTRVLQSSWILQIEDQTWTGSAIEPVITVYNGETELTLDTDYTVEYSNNTDVGLATVTISAMGDTYSDPSPKASNTFTIRKAAATISFAEANVYKTFGDEKFIFAVTNMPSGDTPNQGLGTVSYTSTNPDVATIDESTGEVTIVGVGITPITATVTDGSNYTYSSTTAEYTLTVGQGDLSSATVQLSQPSYTYDGTEKKPEVTVQLGEKTLGSNDYTVDYTDNTNAGTATVTVNGKGNYIGTASKTFTINPKELTNDMIQDIEDQTWTGSAIEPEITVMDGETKLSAGTDYDVVYDANTNAGNATVTITGKGNYSGTATKNFNILKAAAAISFAEPNVDKTFGDEKFTNAVTNTPAGNTLDEGLGTVNYTSSNPDVATIDESTGEVTIVGAGEAIITATVTDGLNYTYSSTTATYTLTIAAKELTNDMIQDIEDKTWTGSAIEPEITVMDGETELRAGTDYDVFYDANTNVGTATVTITGKGNYSGTATKNFNILKAAAAISFAEANVYKTFGDEKFIIAVTNMPSGDTPEQGLGTVSYTSINPDVATIDESTGEVTIVGAGEAIITATVTDGLNYTYSSTTAEYTLTVGQGDLSSATVQLSQPSYTYDGTEKKPEVTVQLGEKTLGSNDYTVGYTDNTNAGTATVTVNGAGNYIGTASKTFTINPKALTDEMIHPIADRTFTGTAIEPEITVMDGETTLTPTDYTVAYSNNTNAAASDAAENAPTATVTGQGNYIGTASKTFTINPKELTNDMIQDIEDQTWTGSAIEPQVTVMDGETELSAGTDYDVVYDANTNAGNATVSINGKGNYSGTASKNFNIVYNTVTLSDDAGVSALQTYAGQTCAVTYERQFTAGTASTVCLPFDYTKKVGDGSFYAFTGVTEENGQYVATMTEPGENTLTANTPYLYMPLTTGETDFSGTYTIPADLTAGSTTSGEWTFKGTYEKIEWTTAPATATYGFSAQNVESAGISQGQFVKVGAYVRILPMRCYLEYNPTGARRRMTAPASGLTAAAADALPATISLRLVGADGTVTAIATLRTRTGEVSLDGWYTLDGIRLSGKPAQKGIYVHNGKKVIIK